MTTFRIDSDDFRGFVTWLIDSARIMDKWSHIRQVHEKPWNWYDDYIQYQHEQEQADHEPDIDEAQEWEDFDPSSTMEAMYGE